MSSSRLGRWRHLVRMAVAAATVAAVAGVTPATAHAAEASYAVAQPFYGGETIRSGSGHRCTAGFIASDGSATYVLTASACTGSASPWYTSGGVLIGPGVGSPADGGIGLIRIDNPGLDPQGAILFGGQPLDVTGAQRVPVGSTVCKSTSTTGTTCGTVLAYNQTVAFPGGTLSGLTRTSLCSGSGEAGTPVVAGSAAQGVVVGTSGGGCTTYLAPVDTALAAYGLVLD